MSETELDPSSTPPNDRPKRARRSRAKALTESAVAPLDASTEGAALLDAAPLHAFAARFRAVGTVASHECPNGHGPTVPVDPGHTWCALCAAHWTVAVAS